MMYAAEGKSCPTRNVYWTERRQEERSPSALAGLYAPGLRTKMITLSASLLLVLLMATSLRAGTAPAQAATPAAAAPAARSTTTASATRATTSTRAAAVTPEDEWTALQVKLHASTEEWGVISPKLQQIRRLRTEVETVAPSSTAASRRGRGGMMGSPMGGTSLDTPIMPAGMNGPRRGFLGSSQPFDPSVAPGRSQPQNTLLKLLGAATTPARRTVNRRFGSSEGNAVEALLVELQTLVETEGATNSQIMEKLSAIRAARAKAARELKEAQDELGLLLTPTQLAILVSLGYLT